MMKKLASLFLCALLLMTGCAFAEDSWTLEVSVDGITLSVDGRTVTLNPGVRLMMGNVPSGMWAELAIVNGESLADLQLVADSEALKVSTTSAEDVLVVDMAQAAELIGVDPSVFLVEMDETVMNSLMDGTMMEILLGSLDFEGMTVTRNSDTSLTVGYAEEGAAVSATLSWNAVTAGCPFDLAAKTVFPVDLNADVTTLMDTDVATAVMTDVFALLEEPSVVALVEMLVEVADSLEIPAAA